MLLLQWLRLLLTLLLQPLLLPSQLSSNLLQAKKNHRKVVFFRLCFSMRKAPDRNWEADAASQRFRLLQIVGNYFDDALCGFRVRRIALAIQH